MVGWASRLFGACCNANMIWRNVLRIPRALSNAEYSAAMLRFCSESSRGFLYFISILPSDVQWFFLFCRNLCLLNIHFSRTTNFSAVLVGRFVTWHGPKWRLSMRGEVLESVLPNITICASWSLAEIDNCYK